MSVLHYDNNEIRLRDDQSVLDSLLDAGHAVPHSCKAGVCQTCMMQADDGPIPAIAQAGLKPTQVAAGYFLACRCYPKHTMHIRSVDQSQGQYTATVLDKRWLNATVLRLRLSCPDMTFHAGQYLTLWKDAEHGRSYSIASLPEDPYIELHLKIYDAGRVSGWAARTLETGDTVQLQGPLGTCFYTPDQPRQTLLLAGVGTGLAPLYGIVRDALAQGHTGHIHLFTASNDPAGLYYLDELTALADAYTNVQITAVVQSLIGNPPSAINDLVVGDLNQVLQKHYPDTKGCRIYLCGSTQRVKNLQRQCFLGGANMSDIYCDLFG